MTKEQKSNSNLHIAHSTLDFKINIENNTLESSQELHFLLDDLFITLYFVSQMECETNLDSQRSFLDACKKGYATKVQQLIERGADTEAKDNFYRTPLHFACAGEQLDMVKLLIERGADTEAKDVYGRTPLHFACAGGNLDLVKLLIGQGKSNFEAKDLKGWTPLLIASLFGWIKVIDFLLEKGANVRHVDNDGNTALHMIAKR